MNSLVKIGIIGDYDEKTITPPAINPSQRQSAADIPCLLITEFLQAALYQ